MSCLLTESVTKKPAIVIIVDKLAFANKEGDLQIWSLKGREDRDHHLRIGHQCDIEIFNIQYNPQSSL